MKKLIPIILVLSLMFTFCACGSKAEAAYDKADPAAPAGKAAAEEKSIEEEWGDIGDQAEIKTEKGVSYIYVTLPEGFAGTDATQKDIDAKAGKAYTSGKLNKDGSVTLKMTKQQHQMMLDSYAATIEKDLLDMCDGTSYAISKITHNDKYTEFDVYLTTNQLGIGESVAAFSFYVYGMMYNTFSGHQGEKVTVNYYGANGNLISTSNSEDM